MENAPNSETGLVERIQHTPFPPGYAPEQVTVMADGIEVASLEYWLLLDGTGRSALLPRGVVLTAGPRETVEQFIVRAALVSEQLLSPDV